MKKSVNYLDRFQKIVCFLTLVNVKKRFLTLAAYEQAANCRKAFCLNIPWRIVAKLTKTPDGESHLQEFLDQSKHLFVYHRHCHKHYKSDKTFSRNSWFELDGDWLRENFKNENFNSATCTFLTKEYHAWIDKRVFFTKNNENTKDKKMTSRQFARYGAPRKQKIDVPKDDLPHTEQAKPVNDDIPNTEWFDKQAATLQGMIDRTELPVSFVRMMASAIGSSVEFRDPPTGGEFTALDLKRRLGLVLRTGAGFLKKTKLHETDGKYLTTAEKRVLDFLCGVNDGRPSWSANRFTA